MESGVPQRDECYDSHRFNHSVRYYRCDCFMGDLCPDFAGTSAVQLHDLVTMVIGIGIEYPYLEDDNFCASWKEMDKSTGRAMDPRQLLLPSL